jgi:type IV secretory pathway TrbD component
MMTHIKALLGTLAAIVILAAWVWIIINYPLTLILVCISTLLTIVYLKFYRHFKK